MKTEARYPKIWTNNGDLVEVKNTNKVEFDVEPTTINNEMIRRFTPEKEASFTCTFENDAGNEFLVKTPNFGWIDNVHVDDGMREMMEELKELKARVNRTVALVHNCQRCGATLEVDEHKAIFCCKYCGATYLLGAVQPNSVYN